VAKLHRTVFAVPKMDCPSEENLVRMTMAGLQGIASVHIDLHKRELQVVHAGSADDVGTRLASLELGATRIRSEDIETTDALPADGGDAGEARTLRTLLAINGTMFLLELTLGLLAESTGLVADALDMFADAAVYGLALHAVGRSARLKARAARVAGWLQLALALAALGEVARRFVFGSEPQSELMMAVGLLALLANAVCLVLVAPRRHRGAHMKASVIFSANDVMANLGVIAAGALVAWTGSPYPDLLIGTLIAVVVLEGARRILKLSSA
jgi:Co/Zn/Cd efflux system component